MLMEQSMLKLQFKDRRQEGVWLVEPKLTIGKSPKNHLVLKDTEVSDFHTEILVKNNVLTLKDLGSNSGTFLNDTRLTGENAIRTGDIVKVGAIELEVSDPKQRQQQDTKINPKPQWFIESDASWLKGKTFGISGALTVGREADCDINIPVPQLSRKHAELSIKGGRLHIRDLNSSNGTFINDKKVTEAYAKPGDKIRFDIIRFQVMGPSDDDEKTIVRPSALQQKSKFTAEAKKAAPKPKPQPQIKTGKARPNSLGNRPGEEPVEEKSSWGYVVFGFVTTLIIIGAALYWSDLLK